MLRKIRSCLHFTKHTKKNLSDLTNKQDGNIFFMLFGAVAVVGLLGTAVMSTMRGPLSTMVEIQSRTQAESEMAIASRLALLEATELASDGDCDGDGFVEPLEFADAGGLGPVGGGFLPNEIASSHIDPWGTEYGYCAWDAGSATGTLACDIDSSGINDRRDGNSDPTDETYTVIAIISAGPDQVFGTTCTGGATPSIAKTGDDMVVEYTYASATSATNGLWHLKSGSPEIAEISKNLEITGEASFSAGIDLTGSSEALALGAASMLFPNDTTLGTCNSANNGLIRINTSADPDFLELCDDPTGWVAVGGPGLWTANSSNEIYFDSAGTTEVGIGTTSPDHTLDIDGTLESTGAVDFGSTLNVAGAGTFQSSVSVVGSYLSGTGNISTVSGTVSGNILAGNTLLIGNAASIGGTLGVAAAVDFDSTLNVDGISTLANVNAQATTVTTLNATDAVDFDTTLNVDGTSTLADVNAQGTISNSSGNVNIGDTVDISETLNITQNLNVTGDGDIDGTLEADDYTWGGNDFTPETCASGRFNRWDGSSWVCEDDTVGGGGGGSSSLNALSDVAITSPADGSCLTYDNGSGDWIDTDCTSTTSAGIFENASNVIRVKSSAGDYATDDFVFGSPQLDDDGDTDHDARMFFDKSKAAFRVGEQNGGRWDDTSIGRYSFAAGWRTLASGQTSTALGRNVDAIGDYSLAWGWDNEAFGTRSVTFGRNIQTGASASESFAFGLGVMTGRAQVSAANSFGIFMGDQTGVDLATANTMLLAGGKLVIDSAVPATETSASTGGEQDLELDVTGDIGADNYCDADGNNCTAAANLGGGLWTDLGGGRIHYGTTSANQIGVGTSNPQTTLDVNGGIRVGSVSGGATPTFMNLGDLGDTDTSSQADNTCLVYQIGSSSWEAIDCATAAAGNNVFQITSGVVNTVDTNAPYSTADFVFGSPQLDDDGDANHDNRMFFDKSKGAFRVGTETGTNWDDANVGTNSIALGRSANASGNDSAAMGAQVTASGLSSFAIGLRNTAGGQGSFALGIDARATNTRSIAIGNQVTTSGQYSLGFGLGGGAGTDSTISGFNSLGIFMGDQSGVDLAVSNRMGLYGGDFLIDDDGTAGSQGCIRYTEGTGLEYSDDCTTYSTFTSLSGGLWTDNTTHITRENFHVLNIGLAAGSTTASLDGDGTYAFFDPDKGALRGGTISGSNDAWQDANIGNNSFAWGVNAQASGNYSAAISGRSANATGAFSFAVGDYSNATADFAVAIGQGTAAYNTNAVAIGKNIRTTGSNAFGFGLGTASGADPVVSGASSFGIFMGDQSGYNLSTANRMALVGGDFLIDDDGTAGSQGCIRYVEGTGIEFSDDCTTYSTLASLGGGLWTDNTTHITRENFHVLNTGATMTSAGFDTGLVGMAYHTDKQALRIGQAVGNQWEETRIGNYSVVFGSNSQAQGAGAFGAGNNVGANGFASISLGDSVVTTGSGSVALGGDLNVSGGRSIALGQETFVSGDNSMGIGLGNATGTDPTVSGDNSLGIFMGDQSGVDLTGANTMAILGGNVGIGTVSPLEELHVRKSDAGDPPIIQVQNDAAFGGVGIRLMRNSSKDGSAFVNFGNGNSVNEWGIGVRNSDLDFAIWDSDTGDVNRFEIDATTGYVGIGNFSSDTIDSTLHLATGDIRLDGVIGNEAGCIRYNDTTDELEFSDDCTTFATISSIAGSAGLWTDNTTHVTRENFHILNTGLAAGSTTAGLDGDGTYAFFDPDKGALRGGSIGSSNDAWQDANIGPNSFAWGSNAQASSTNSRAMGNHVTASGGYSTAIGSWSTASGNSSATIGTSNVASGDYSTTIGRWNTASGTYGVAIGTNGTASGNRTVALGSNATAAGDYSLAFGAGYDIDTSAGADATVSGDYSVGVFMGDQDGIDITDTNTMAILGGDFIVGSYQLDDTATGNQDNRMFFDTSKGAFRAGGTSAAHWDDVNVGAMSTALGWWTEASGGYSFAVGNQANAAGDASIAMGQQTIASGDNAMAIGLGSSSPGYPEVSGNNSLGIFMGNQATTDLTVANRMGLYGGDFLIDDDGTAGSQGCIRYVEGTGLQFSDDCTAFATISSIASSAGLWSDNTTHISRGNMHVINTGETPTTAGIASGLSETFMWHADQGALRLGRYNTAGYLDDANIGLLSFATGNQPIASGNYSVSMGYQTQATMSTSIAIGTYARATGARAIALGNTVIADGQYAFGFGLGNAAGTAPTISADNSFGIFMGDQSGYDLTTANRMALVGGDFLIDDDGTAGSQGCIRYTEGTGLEYSDDCATYATFASLGSGLWTDNTTHITRENTHILDAGATMTTAGFDAGVSGFVFHTDKNALRAGRASGNHWQESNVGADSIALGANVTASAQYAVALGYSSSAIGYSSIAWGYNTTATGSGSAVFGGGSSASGPDAMVYGKDSTASGNHALAIGSSATSAGAYSLTFGAGYDIDSSAGAAPAVSGDYSIGLFMGDNDGIDITDANTMAILGGDLIVGSYQLDDTATGSQDNRMFFDSSKGAFRAGTAISNQWDDANVGDNSAAFGRSSYAGGNGSFAAGALGNASGSSSISLGYWGTASGDASVFLGRRATASGNSAFAFGLGTPAGTAPVVSATESFGIFMGDQSGVDLAVNNRMGLYGGDFLIDDDGTAGSQGCIRYTEGTGLEYSHDCSTYATMGAVASGTLAIDDLSDAYTDYATDFNMYLGDSAGVAASPGQYNIAVGQNALTSLDTTCSNSWECNNNIALGYDALTASTTGSSNIAIGYNALTANTTEGNNVAIGINALAANTQSNNTAIGTNALTANTSGSNQVAIGYDTLSSNLTGSANIAIGNSALSDSTTTNYAIAIGTSAGKTGGEDSIAIGNAALENSTASFNVAMGNSALTLNTTGYSNTAIGMGVMDANLTGSENAAFGGGSLGANIDGGSNTAFGPNSLSANTSGSRNIAIGHQAGDNITTGWSNIIIGYGVDAPSATDNNQLNIGNLIYGDLANRDFIVGSYQLNDTGTGTEDNRMFFDSSKGAFRAGSATGTEWDDGNVGSNSIAFGSGTTASGDYSTAIGAGTTASAIYSTAIGISSTASGTSSTAIGFSTTASNAGSLAMGYNTTSSGISSTAIGDSTTASGAQSTAIGYYVNANGNSSMGTGLQSATQTTVPIITGDRSAVFFFDGGVANANSTYDFTESDKFAIIGGEFQIDSDSSTADKGCIRYNDTSDELEYSDDCSTYFTFASAGASNINDLTDGITDYATDFNMFMGDSAGASIATGGQYNIGIGQSALTANATGDYNIALGYEALNAATENNNIAIGYQAGYNTATATTMDKFTGVGYQAGYSNTGDNVTAVGYQAAELNTGATITAFGYQAAENNSGNLNVLVGYEAGENNTGSASVAVGNYAIRDNTGSYIAALGNGAARDNTGSYVTALGYQAARENTGGSVTAIGHDAVRYRNATNSVVIGRQAGYGANTTRADTVNSVFLGYRAGYGIDTGDNNIFLGYQAGDATTTGSDNILIGYDVDTPLATTSDHLNIGNLIYGDLANEYLMLGNPNMLTLDNSLQRYQFYSSNDRSDFAIGTANNTSKSDIDIFRARGSISLETAVQDNDVLGSIRFTGYDGDTFETRAQIKGEIDGTVSDETVPTALVFSTGTTSQIERMRIDASGNVGIGDFSNDTIDSTLHLAAGDIRLDGGAAGQAGCIRFDDTSDALEYSDDCSTYSTFASAGANAINDLTDAVTDYATDNNMFIGQDAGTSIASGGIQNLFIGQNSGTATTTGDYNTAIGYNTLAANIIGTNNSATGNRTLESNTTGIDNTATGDSTMRANTIGSLNTAIGNSALRSNVAKSRSTAIGYQSMFYADNTITASNSNNTAIGYQALYGSTTAANNTGISNTSIGANTMLNNTSGGHNIALGYQTGDLNTTGSDNILIGYDIDAPTATTSNHLNIGGLIYGDLANGVVMFGTTDSTNDVDYSDPFMKSSNGLDVWYRTFSNNTGIKTDIDFQKAGGTEASPIAISDGHTLGGIRFSGYDGDSWENRAGINGEIDGTVSNETVPTALTFNTGSTSIAERMRISAAGDIGIGTDSPTDILTIVGDGQDIHHYSYSNTFNYKPDWYGYRARGTEASPTIVQDGDLLAGIGGHAYDGNSWELTGQIWFEVNGTPANENVPTDIVFSTGVNSAIERMRIDSNGDIIMAGRGALTLHSGATAVRPSTPVNGMIRYNTDNNAFEGYENSTWTNIIGGGGLWTDNTTHVTRESFHILDAGLAAGSTTAGLDGDGTYAFYDPDKGAMRGGEILSSAPSWQDANIGTNSFAWGGAVEASGTYSAALGFSSTASGYVSTALGYGTTASGDFSTSIGYGSESSALYSFASGRDSTASGERSTALGQNATAAGYASFAAGRNGNASGYVATTLGNDVEASGDWGIAFGNEVRVGDGTIDATTPWTADGTPGEFSVAYGLGAPAGTHPQVSGVGSFGIFMGDQSGYDLTTNNRMALIGGDFLIDDDGTAGSQGCIRYVEGSGLEFSDDCTTFASLASLSDSGAIDDLSDGRESNSSLYMGTGTAPSATGDANMILGLNSATDLTSGRNNTVFGNGALVYNETGHANIAIGLRALAGDTSANANGTGNNVAIGYQSMRYTYGNNNVAIGYTSLDNAGESDGNVAIGLESGTALNTDGSNSNTFLGFRSASNQTAGSDNIVIGANQDAANLTGSDQLNIGGLIYGDLANGDFIVGSYQLDDTGTGTEDNRMFFDSSKGAFRAGTVTGTEWDDGNVGSNSIAFGSGTTASGNFSAAFGSGSTASGIGSTAFGAGSTASGVGGFAAGGAAIASGVFSTAIGSEVVAGSGTAGDGNGDASVVIGLQTSPQTTDPIVTGDRSMVLFFDQGSINGNDAYDFTESDKFAIIGGEFQIGETQAQGAAKGCIRYNDTSNALEFSHDCSTYVTMAGVGGGLIDADADTQIQVEEGADDDTIRFDTTGTERMVIGSTGNVGIATTSPAATLDISAATGAYPKLMMTATDITSPDFSGSASVGVGSSTNVFGLIQHNLGASGTNTEGGMYINGITESGENAWNPLHLVGTHGGTAPTTAAVTISSQKWSGTNNRASLSGTEIVLDVERGYKQSTTLMRLLADGSLGLGDFKSDIIESALHIQTGDIRLDGGAGNEEGCIRFDDTTDKLQFSNDCTTFTDIDNASIGLSDADADTLIQVEEGSDDDTIRFDTAGTERMVIDNAGNVGIGTDSPTYMLTITGDNKDFALYSHNGVTPSNGTDILLHRSAGTYDTPTAVSADDKLGGLRFIGYDGTAYERAAAIYAYVDTGATIADEDIPAYLSFHTRSTANTDSIERMVLTSAGDLNISTASAILTLGDGSANNGTPSLDFLGDSTNKGARIQYDGISDTLIIRGLDTNKAEQPLAIAVARDTGYVGIATAIPNVALDVTGDIEYTGTITDVSDRRLKDNIVALNQSGDLLDRIAQIDTYSFTMKDDEKGRTEYGVMAQELEEIFPTLVHTADDEIGTKSVNYVGLIAPMIEATKELRAENTALKSGLDDLSQQVALLNKIAQANDTSKVSMEGFLMLLLGLFGGGAVVFVFSRKKA